jgi:hypothetical protein
MPLGYYTNFNLCKNAITFCRKGHCIIIQTNAHHNYPYSNLTSVTLQFYSLKKSTTVDLYQLYLT